MRVLHVSQPTTEGVARIVAQLVRDQVARGWEVSVACPPGGDLAGPVTAAGATWLPWPATRAPGPSTAGETVRLHRLVAAADPAVVHLHSSKAGLAGRLAVRGRRPTVFSPQAWSFLATGGALRAASLSWERAAARWTHLALLASEAERRAGDEAGVRARRTVVVPNGVELGSWPAATQSDRVAARAALGLDDAPLAVCVGRLAPQKGQDLLLDAWPRVRAAAPTARLVLVGDGPDADALRGRAEPGVALVGASTRVGEWFAAADVVVVPSRWEGMALVPLEAMARGRSVVAFDVEGVRESVPDGGGAVLPAGDVAGLADAVAQRLTGGGADEEGRVGRAHALAAHDAARTAQRVAELYGEVVAAGRRA